jgi:quercetin dioxygenase-like cupin family protein
MKYYIITLCSLFTLFPHGVTAEELLKTKTSWDGGEIYYPKGQIEITSKILRIEKNQVTKFHCHPVPTLGYVIRGSVEVETKNGNKIILREGESAVEVMRTIHRGRAINGPVEIIVFYAGSTTLPTTVFPENDSSKGHCIF